MIHMNTKLLALLIAAPAVLAAQAPAPRIISLDEAIRMAQQNSPSALQARGRLKTSSNALRAAYTGFLPSGLSVSAGASKRNGIWNYSNSLSTNISIFDPNKFITIGRAKRDLATQEISELQNRYTVAQSVKQQFFAVISARETETAAKSSLAISEAQLANTVARVTNGTGLYTDSMSGRISVTAARIAVLSASNSLRQANATLTRTVGSDTPVEANPADTAGFKFAVLDSAALSALVDSGPAMQQSLASVATSEYSVKSAKFAYLPKLNGFSFSRSGSGTGAFGFDDSPFKYSSSQWMNFGISLQLWDNFSRENSMVSANISLDNARASLHDQKLAQQLSFLQLLGQLRTTEEQIKLQQSSIAYAEVILRNVQQRYNLGLSLQLEVLTAQNSLQSAKQTLISQRATYRNAKAQLEALIGRDLD
jgi:outer membrane protein TolC